MLGQCSIRISGEGRWGAFHPRQCENPAVVERGGKAYCKIHDPEYRKAQEAKRKVKRETTACPKCGSSPKYCWLYCPFCGTKYPHHQ